MVEQRYRWDFIGLSTDEKPNPNTSPRVVDGSTFYCSDNSKLYVWCKDQWYERKALGGEGTTYTAGTGIDIDDNTISVDSSEITFTGTDGETAGSAGTVPAPSTTDADKFLKSDGTWATAGGGSGPTVVQTTGTSTTDVMSQNAVTSMVYADPDTMNKIKIGNGAYASEGDDGIEIGHNSKASASYAVGIGSSAEAKGQYSVAIGYGTETTGNGVSLGYGAKAQAVNSVAFQKSMTRTQGQVQFELQNYASSEGYNNTKYRLLSGLHDGQDLHDASTVAQGNTLATSAPTTSTVGVLGQLYTDTTNMHTYQCTAISGSTYTWTQRW